MCKIEKDKRIIVGQQNVKMNFSNEGNLRKMSFWTLGDVIVWTDIPNQIKVWTFCEVGIIKKEKC